MVIKGMAEDETVRWHHWLSGHEFKQTLGASGGQRRLVHWSPWVHNELDLATEQHFSSGEGVSVSSASQSCLTLCDPMDCSTPGFPVHHQLLEHAQTHVHRVGDAIQPSHPLSSPSPPAFNLSQHQGLFQWVCLLFPSGGQGIGVSASASALLMNIQDWFPLGQTGWVSLQSEGLSRVSNTTVQKHQFFSTQLSSQSNSNIHTWLLERP